MADGRDSRRGLQGIQGRDGAPGRHGTQGPPGTPGADGADGADGKDGRHGKDGAPGIAGRHGKDGERGLLGAVGPEGPEGKPGPQGKPGRDGADGRDGERGPPPEHQWDGTRLRFRRPDGSWGPWVDLKGPGGQVFFGGGSFNINGAFNGLPLADGTTPDYFLVHQASGWKRATLAQMIDWLGGVAPSEPSLDFSDADNSQYLALISVGGM